MKYRIYLTEEWHKKAVEAFYKNAEYNPQNATEPTATLDVLHIESVDIYGKHFLSFRTEEKPERPATHNGLSGFSLSDIVKIEPIV